MVLKHLPTNIVVRVHDSRDQLVNRKLARKLLYDKLDVLVNGETSKIALRDARKARTKDRARRKREQKAKSDGGLTPNPEDSDDDNLS